MLPEVRKSRRSGSIIAVQAVRELPSDVVRGSRLHTPVVVIIPGRLPTGFHGSQVEFPA